MISSRRANFRCGSESLGQLSGGRLLLLLALLPDRTCVEGVVAAFFAPVARRRTFDRPFLGTS